MRRRHKKKLWMMGGIGVLTAVLYSVQYLLFLRKVRIVFTWFFSFSAIALALAPIYLRIGKDHTVNIPASIERRHRYMLIAMPVLAFVSTTVMGVIDGGSFYDILFWVISALLCCASFVLDLTGRRYPALIITGTNILISFLCDYSTCTALLYLLLLLFLHGGPVKLVSYRKGSTQTEKESGNIYPAAQTKTGCKPPAKSQHQKSGRNQRKAELRNKTHIFKNICQFSHIPAPFLRIFRYLSQCLAYHNP